MCKKQERGQRVPQLPHRGRQPSHRRRPAAAGHHVRMRAHRAQPPRWFGRMASDLKSTRAGFMKCTLPAALGGQRLDGPHQRGAAPPPGPCQLNSSQIMRFRHGQAPWRRMGQRNVDSCRGTQLQAAGMQAGPRLRICCCAARKLRVSPVCLTHFKAAVGLTVRLKVQT